MKLQWKLIIGVLIGMLVIGQVIAIGYVVAGNRDLLDAQSQARDAANALTQAQTVWTSVNDTMQKMMAMPNGPEKEKAMGNVMQQQSNFDQRILNANVHALNALNHIWTHLNSVK